MSEDPRITDEQRLAFVEFVAGKRILIADASQSIRSSLSKALSDLGAKSSQIFLASNFNEALERIRSLSPEVVICDYHLDERCGLELIPVHRESRPSAEERLFILVTGNSAESVVAEAAEEDVDAYILKPFTGTSIRYYLVRAGLAKAQPSQYRVKLTHGKQFLQATQLTEAMSYFSEALEMDESPTLACYYMGQVYEKMRQPEQSEQSYKNGLMFNEIHYKCSVGLFDLYVGTQQLSEAYSVMRKISQHFPISPQRLTKTIELAVKTQNFSDISHYYAIFKNIDERRDDLRKCVCAALVVGAMFQLRQGQNDGALEFLQNAAITAAGSAMILREIVMILVNFNLPDPAQAFLKRFPAESQYEANYLCAEFALLNLTGKIEEVIVRGRKLLRDGVQDPSLHKIMIRRELEARHPDEADSLATEAISIWPEESESFQKALKPL